MSDPNLGGEPLDLDTATDDESWEILLDRDDNPVIISLADSQDRRRPFRNDW